jgi:hypothetical protein
MVKGKTTASKLKTSWQTIRQKGIITTLLAISSPQRIKTWKAT